MKLRLGILPIAAAALAVMLAGVGNAWADDNRNYDRGHGSRHEQERRGHSKRNHDGGVFNRGNNQWRQKHRADQYSSRDRVRGHDRSYRGGYDRHYKGYGKHKSYSKHKGYGKHKGYSKKYYRDRRHQHHYGKGYYRKGPTYYSYQDDDDDDNLLYGLLFGGLLGYVIGQSQPDNAYDY